MKKYILEYIEYLEEFCSTIEHEKALYEISIYKVKSATMYEEDICYDYIDVLYSILFNEYSIDIVSYRVFEKRIKTQDLLKD